jgi:hypothetical protein
MKMTLLLNHAQDPLYVNDNFNAVMYLYGVSEWM